jgi:Fe2+ transport system protein FeoA
MKIALLIEGQTERAFLPHFRQLLQARLPGRMPRLDPEPYDGRIPTGDRLRREVERLLRFGKPPADAVIALTDVYTGTTGFTDAQDAKSKMRAWVGHNNKFYPHAAQYEFEAWLLPFWGTIQRLAAKDPADLRKLLALGLLPGVELEVERRWPAVVLRLDYASVALDAGLAEAVLVSPAV